MINKDSVIKQLQQEEFDPSQILKTIFKESNLHELNYLSIDDADEKLDQIDNLFQNLDQILEKEQKKLEKKLEDEILINEINNERQEKKKQNTEKQLIELKTSYQTVENQLKSIISNHDFQIQLYENDTQLKIYSGLTQSQAQGQIQVQIQNEQQKNINSIEIKFKEISQYIISKFKHAFMRIEVKNIQTLLKIIDQFKMVDTITSYYIEHFLSDLKINNQFKDREFSSSQEDLETQFFLLQKAFKRVLSVKISQETNFYQVQQIFGGYSQIVIRQFIKYSFEHIIDKLQDNLLDDKYKNGIHYQWLKIFEFLWNKCLELEKVIQHIDFGENFTLQAFTKDIFSSFMRNSFEQKKNFYFEIEITYLETVMKDNTYQLIDQIKQEAKEKTVYYNKSEKLKYELQKWIDYKIKHKDQEKPKLNKEQMEGRIEVLQQILVMDNINIIFHKVNESLLRSKILSPVNLQNNHRNIILETFLKIFANDLMVNLLYFMSDIVPQLNRKTHLNPKFFTLIPQFNTLIQRIDLIFEDAIKSDSMSYELELLGKKKQKQIQNLEILIQNQNQNALAIIYIHANQLLNENQSKKDFLAKQVSDKLKETNAIRLFIEFIQSYTYVIEKNASPINKSRYFDAIGEQIIKILIDHYPQYKVTQSGSFQIQADISYVEKFLLKVINAKTLQRKLDQLKSLINIFKLDQESLKRYIKEECLQNIPTEIVDQYILAKKN